ncbi:MAG: ATP-dependent DNA helicase RecG, partial [Actinobacteria bacterium]|nr:ATP-dependent DNA helicase RecG [Actinomycetota bacterium]
QLRGRVGRGGAAGLCLLVTTAEPESSARIRLDAVAASVDGFELSRIDLEQRREGDVLGASQSGTQSHLRLLRVLRDEDLIDLARKDAQQLIETDPQLGEYPHLAKELKRISADESIDYIDKG